jgi:hypothetical protein
MSIGPPKARGLVLAPAAGNARLAGACSALAAFARRPARRQCRRQCNGAALPVVLSIASMLLLTSAAWLETSIADVRRVANLHDSLQAFHAADAALTLCARALRAGVAPALPAVGHEPARWKETGAFEGPLAFTPQAQWPGTARAPQCLIEAWQLVTRPQVQAYLLTARGFGASETTLAWLQLEIVMDGETLEETHWRRIVARPA